MDKEWSMVKEFQLKFGHPVSEFPKYMEKDRVLKRSDWMLEEIDEFVKANEIVEQADSIIDLIYFALGTLVEMGIRPDNLFEIVQNANMAKLWSDGKAHYNNEGKVIKPEIWGDPHKELQIEIDRQKEESMQSISIKKKNQI